MSQVYSGHLKNKVLSIASSGVNEVIAAPSDGYIVIDHINLVNTSAVSVTFKSATTALSGVYPLAEKQPITLENAYHSEQGVITCGRNEAFNIELSGAVQVSGFIRYRIIGNP
jgi:hypothetical protein